MLLSVGVGDTGEVGFSAVSSDGTTGVAGGRSKGGVGAVDVTEANAVSRPARGSEVALASTDSGVGGGVGHDTLSVVASSVGSGVLGVASCAGVTTGKGRGGVGDTNGVDGSEAVGLVVGGKNSLVETGRGEVGAGGLVGAGDAVRDGGARESSGLRAGESGERNNEESGSGGHLGSGKIGRAHV